MLIYHWLVNEAKLSGVGTLMKRPLDCILTYSSSGTVLCKCKYYQNKTMSINDLGMVVLIVFYWIQHFTTKGYW